MTSRRLVLAGLGAGALALAGARLGRRPSTMPAAAGAVEPRVIPQSLAGLEVDAATAEGLVQEFGGRAELLGAGPGEPAPRAPETTPGAAGDAAPRPTPSAAFRGGRVSPDDLRYLDRNAPTTAMGLSAVRGLWLVNAHTGEETTGLFWNAGQYDNGAYTALCSMLRDWRENETTAMDPRLFHLLWAVQREIDFRDPICITSGFRTVKTNTMLQSEGAAPNSQHMHSRACDIQIAGRAPGTVAQAVQRMRIGGVGYYSTFTHIDTGPIRVWRV